jgi:hypothetical protein
MNFKFSAKDLLYDLLISLYGKESYTLTDFRVEIANQMKASGIKGDALRLEENADEYIEKLFNGLEKRFEEKENSMSEAVIPKQPEKNPQVERFLNAIENIKPDKDCKTCWEKGKMNLNGAEVECNCIVRRREMLKKKLIRMTGHVYVGAGGAISMEEFLRRQRNAKEKLLTKEVIEKAGIDA